MELPIDSIDSGAIGSWDIVFAFLDPWRREVFMIGLGWVGMGSGEGGGVQGSSRTEVVF